MSIDNPPVLDSKGNPYAYTKPVIFLIDNFSMSAAEIFAATMQDNHRGLLVGTRTAGGGGSISSWPTGFFSESSSSNTNTMVVRKDPVAVPGYPTESFIENVGVHPDVFLDLMTQDNLLQGGLPYVQDFSGVIVSQILQAEQ